MNHTTENARSGRSAENDVLSILEEAIVDRARSPVARRIGTKRVIDARSQVEATAIFAEPTRIGDSGDDHLVAVADLDNTTEQVGLVRRNSDRDASFIDVTA